MKRILGGILVIVTLVSCETGFYETVSENTVSPEASRPQVSVFASLSGIPVAWAPDANADEFVVTRRVLTGVSATEVFRGTANRFLDTTADPYTMYMYTLAKSRGDRTFPPGTEAVGAWSPLYLQDPNGANDTKETASPMGTNTVSERVFFYSGINAGDSQRIVLDDQDWFYVDLGPRLQLYFVLLYKASSQSGQLVVSSTSDVVVMTNTELSVFNPTTSPQRLWFNVHFNKEGFASSTTQAQVDYELQFNTITNYNPIN